MQTWRQMSAVTRMSFFPGPRFEASEIPLMRRVDITILDAFRSVQEVSTCRSCSSAESFTFQVFKLRGLLERST
jgi:hypothetical protein